MLGKYWSSSFFRCKINKREKEKKSVTTILQFWKVKYNVYYNGSFRGIEWYLRAFTSMRAVPLFLRVRAAVITFFLRAASILQNMDGEQRALRKFSAGWNLSFIKRKHFAPSNLADALKTGYLMGENAVQPIPPAYNRITSRSFTKVGELLKLWILTRRWEHTMRRS